MMTPGPTKPTAEQLQRFAVLIVDDLIRLYEHGIKIVTPLHPEGLLVQLTFCLTVSPSCRALGMFCTHGHLGIVCNHLAMCKMAGFADKSHKVHPCMKCHTTLETMFDDKWMTGGMYLVLDAIF